MYPTPFANDPHYKLEKQFLDSVLGFIEVFALNLIN